VDWPTLVVALAAGAAGLAGSYAAAGFTPAFVLAPVGSYLTRVTPGLVITFAITVLGDLGQRIALVGGIALAVAAYASFALLALAVGRASGSTVAGAVLGGALARAFTTLLTGASRSALGAAAPVAGTILLPAWIDRAPVTESVSPARRRVLGTLGAVAGFGALAAVVGASRTPDPTAGSEPTDRDARALLDDDAAKSFDLAGLEPLVSEEFYGVDINNVDPDLDREECSLSITGEVASELELSYKTLTDRPADRAFTTLRCVGERLNGQKMDTALWTVTEVGPLLEAAGVEASDACCVMARAADGYYEEFPLAALERAKLAYRMNGRPLPRGHGSPVRLLVPGHWGEIDVKWLTESEVLDEPVDGYWEERGWHGTGPVEPVAKLHAVEHDREAGRVAVGGHAYAGTRGVSRVEMSTDGGSTWADAALSEPIEGIDVWRQWIHEYDHPGGSHEVVVRVYDGDGRLQPKEQRDAFPRGPSGWVSRRIR